MQRSYKSLALVACAVLMAISGLGLVPAAHALAAPAAPTAAAQQIIFLSGNGQIQALNWQQSSLGISVAWSSSTFPSYANGWTNIVAGDFNGDGKADIVATQYGTIRAFFPALGVTNAVDPIDLPQDPSPGSQYHLLAAGRFQSLNRDQLAATYRYLLDDVWHEVVLVFTYQNNGTWSRIVVNDFGYRLQSVATGDLNRDGYADLTLLAFDNKTIEIRAGQASNQNLLQSLLYDPPENAYCCNWWAAAVGNIDRDNNDTDHPGNEVALQRDTGTAGGVNSTLLGWLRPPSSDPADVHTLDTFWGTFNYPNFTSMALGDINGDGDMEIVQLRDPGGPGIYVSAANPSGSGAQDPAFEAYGNFDYGSNAWTQVAAGDINGDSRAEVVLMRSSGSPGMRVFYNPQANAFRDFGGSPWPQGLTIADLGLAGFVVSQQNVSFLRQIGSTTYPAARVINVDGFAVPWQATVTPNVNWLSVSPLAGSTPQAVTLTINPAAADAMGVGTQSTTITFVPNVTGMQPVTVQVNLYLTTSPIRLRYMPVLFR